MEAQPVIEVDGLRLRDFTPGDIALIQSASADPYIPLISTVPTTSDADEALAFIYRQLSRWSSGFGFVWAIANADDDIAMGHLSLRVQGHPEGRASIGYWIGPEHRGRGYASKAVRGLIAWVGPTLAIPRLELYVEPWNKASLRIAEAAGFEREGLLRSWEIVGDTRRDMWMYSLISER